MARVRLSIGKAYVAHNFTKQQKKSIEKAYVAHIFTEATQNDKIYRDSICCTHFLGATKTIEIQNESICCTNLKEAAKNDKIHREMKNPLRKHTSQFFRFYILFIFDA